MHNEIHEYLHKVCPVRHPVLQEMERHAEENGFPIIGPLVGRYLYQTATILKARRIMELGSGYGYSAFWFSLAVKGKGKIVMTDGNRGNKRKAIDFFKRAGLQSQFDFRVGNALNTLKRQEGPFDIILNDIDKIDYPKTIDLVAPRLRKGGVFITDNIIWDGKVFAGKKDATTEAIVEFTRKLYEDSRFFTTVLPIRDGIAVSVRV